MISIIIPALNEEKYLPRLLNSLKNQKFSKKFEIIVADAESTDNTVKVAKNFGCKAVKGGNPSRGRNKGAEVAKGEILLFLDADVILPPDFLEKTTEELLKRNLKVAGFILISQDNKLIYRLIYKIVTLFLILTERFLPTGTIGILATKEVHQKIKGFDEMIKIGEDYDYIRRASKYGKFGVIRSTYILVSPRRFKKEGVWRTIFKYLAIDFHLLFFGPIRKNFISYKFGHYEEK